MSPESKDFDATQWASLTLVRILRWSGRSPIRIFVVCFAAFAAVLAMVLLKAAVYGLRFHLSPYVWSGVYQRHRLASPLLMAVAGLFIVALTAAMTIYVRRRRLRRARVND